MMNINRDTIATYAATTIILDDDDSLAAFNRDTYIDASFAELRDDTDALIATFAPRDATDSDIDDLLELCYNILHDDADFILDAMTNAYDNRTSI